MNAQIPIILYDSATIKAKVHELADKLISEHGLENSVFICVMNGAFIFFSDLVRFLPDTVVTDFCRVTSYGATKVSGLLTTKYWFDTRLFNKNVYIIDDILDSGSTLKFLAEKAEKCNAKSVHTISLLERKNSCKLPNHTSLFTIDDEWVYGYGMDLYGTKRSNPNIMYLDSNID